MSAQPKSGADATGDYSMSHRPLITVTMVTYNQEPYIRESIRSVLNQTISDLELVIVDDGSSDGTAQAVGEFNDPRIVYIRQENQGPGGAGNRAFSESRGKFIAVMTGDDLCHTNRLELQLAAYERAGGGVVFSNVDFIDESGCLIEGCSHYPKDFFLHPPMSQAQILERFFRQGNFINTVTTFTEAEILRSAPFDLLLYQTHDYDTLVRLVKHHRFTIIPQSTLQYRVRNNGGNLSAPNPTQMVRCANEWRLTLRRFFEDVSPELFRDAFAAQLIYPESRSAIELACEQAFLYLNHPTFLPAQLIGVEQLHDLLNQPEAEEVLRTHFRFTRKNYVDLLLRFDLLKQLPPFEMSLLVDTGNDFNENERITSYGNHLQEKFEIAFDLTRFTNIQRVFWEPAKFQLAQIGLEQVFWKDALGKEHPVSLSQIDSNAERPTESKFVFGFINPYIAFPLSSEARQIVFRGTWKFTDSQKSSWIINAQLQSELPQLKEEKVIQDAQIQHLRGSVEILEWKLQQSEAKLAESKLCGQRLEEELHERQDRLQAMLESKVWRWGNAVRSFLRSLLPFRRASRSDL